MPRATTKEDLLKDADIEYHKLIELLNSIPNEYINELFAFDVEKEKGAHWKRDKNIKDVLIHLYEWHNLLLNWVKSNQQGIETSFLPDGYNWKTYGAMNIEFQKKHQHTSYDTSLNLLRNTHKEVINLLKTFSNDELFSKNYLKWATGSTLASYFISTTASHYNWAIKKIKKYKKSIKN